MKRRIFSLVLAICVMLSMMPAAAFAASGTTTSGKLIVSDKSYEVAPGITEREYITNNTNLTAQQLGYVLEVKLGENAEIVVGYDDYNIENIKSGSGWGMKKTTEQAQAVELRTGSNVVAAVNGDFYSMSNGRPSGMLTMDGNVIQNNNGRPYFYIDKDGKPHISAGNEAVPSNLKEGVGGRDVLVKNGQYTGADDGAIGPRTAIGIKSDDTIVIYTVDGRQAPISVGMSMKELAETMIDFGCVSALNLDGGGSSTFATQRAGDNADAASKTAGLTLRNSPSDGYERAVSSSLMIVSTSKADGKFDHAILSPNDEVYTPGSSVNFSAVGADKSGAATDLPTDGLKWVVTSGMSLGSIDENTGVFTGTADAEGKVTVALKYNGTTVGETSIELRWPDKLTFANSSVSLDFGETSDLSFTPTYQGRTLHYKDGDFKWNVTPTSYKYITVVETKSANETTGYPGNGKKDLGMTLNGQIGVTQKLQYSAWGTYNTYAADYVEASNEITVDDSGIINVTSLVKNTAKYTYSGDTETKSTEGLQANQSFTFSIGQLVGNGFKADENNSMKGIITVALKNDNNVSGTVNIIVGMEPVILMDFEAKGDKSAEEYWKIKVGPSDVYANDKLTFDEIRENMIWLRDTTTMGYDFTQGKSGVVSVEEDSRVRFGEYACQLSWGFPDGFDESKNVAACFGFSTAVYIDGAQPTKIGMWINVPKELEDCDNQIKGYFTGGGDGSIIDKDTLGYRTLNSDGSISDLVENKFKSGQTGTYVRYYSYDKDGEIGGSELKDWAGKGWIWIEADLSSLQAPITIERAYSVRIVSPPNYKKMSGSILIDNLQLIYGTNTNDVNNPVIEGVSEKISSTNLKTAGSTPSFSTVSPQFEIQVNDSKLTDKYATGIDLSSVKLYIDGYDCTSDADINQNAATGNVSALLQPQTLTNGGHSLKIRVKDYYGNETTETYSFVIESTEETAADTLLKVEPQSGSPVIGNGYKLNIANQGTEAEYVDSAEVIIDLDESYGEAIKNKLQSSITYGSGYEEAEPPEYNDGKVTIHFKKKDNLAEGESYAKNAASLTLAIPADAAKGSQLRYAVSGGRYTQNSISKTFSQTDAKISLTAKYDISAGQAIVGYPLTFEVTDASGNAVENMSIYCGNDELTNPYAFDTTGRKTVYAKDSEGNRSWNYSVVVNALGDFESGSPFGIQNNATDNGSSSKCITWLAAIGGSQSNAYVKLAKTEAGIETAQNTEGTSKLFTFTETSGGNAYRLNTVKLTELDANTTYYYKVGDGTKWSEILSFTTAPSGKADTTSFFIFADIQTSDTTNLSTTISKIKNSSEKYSFGIQTGDAIDNVTVFDNWRAYLTTLNSSTLGGIDLIHTLGNHEYYGDTYGDVAGDIFGMSQHKAGSYYSAEYGSVYVGVINDGGDILTALQEAKTDSANSDCAWKVLVVHQPIYGTESFMADEKRAAVTAAIEEAGFDVVFSGDDHAYARTYPMKADEKLGENDRDGVVYYVCGDLSGKNNEYHNNDIFKVMIPHNDYSGMYMSVKAEKDKMVLTAYKYDGELLDSYTIAKTDCELGNHKFADDSVYDAVNKTISSCSVCKEDIPASESGYTGMLSVKDSEDHVVLASGQLKTGWFVLGDEIHHAGNDGILHNSTTHNTATCLEDGYIYAKCTCGAANYYGANTYRTGHKWNDAYECTVCGAKGKNIEKVKLSLSKTTWEYTGKNIKPSVVAKDGTYTLIARSDANGRDAYKSYKDNVNVGYGSVVLDGRGDYYGTTSIKFSIVPKSVENITIGATLANAVTLNWEAAAGAQYYQVYQKTGSGAWKEVGKTDDCGMVVSGLDPQTKYYFRVITCADVDGETFQGLNYSEVAELTTPQGNSSDSVDLIDDIKGIISATDESTQTIRTTVTEDDSLYLLLPSYADLTDLSIKLESSNTIDSITVLGTKASAEFDAANEINIDATALSGKNENGEYKIYISVNGANPIEMCIMKSSSLSAVYLSSNDVQNQGREYVDASKSNKAEGSMLMLDKDGNSIYSGILTQIKARGNSTFKYYPKKSYQIKLAAGTDLIGCGENVTTWVLLAGYGDATQMHDKLFKDLAAELGMPYTASCDWVDLYYDGEYRGTYLLSEKNSVGETGINISDMEEAYKTLNPTYGENMTAAEDTNKYEQKIVYTEGLTDVDNITGGYLLELNGSSIDEANGFYTRKEKGFNVKSPEYLSKTSMQYISEYYQEFEDAVYAKDENGNYTGYNAETGKYYYDYCDKESLVQAVLLQQLALNPDGFMSSVYFYKDADGKMYTGPIWDHEMTLGTGFSVKIDPSVVTYHYLEEALVNIPDFKEALEKYYEESFKDGLNNLIKEGGKTEVYYDRLKDSVKMNYLLWPYVEIGSPKVDGHLWAEGTDYDDVIADMNEWLATRVAKLDYLYGDKTEHTEHIYKSTIIREATYTEEGLRKYTCSVCGHSYSETIDKLTASSGGGGGGGAGFAVPSTENESQISLVSKTENGEKLTCVTVKSETSKGEDGSTATKIDISSSDADAIIKELKDSKSAEIVINSNDSGKTTSDVMKLTLPKKLLSYASADENVNSIKLEADGHSLEFSKDVIAAMAQIEGDEAVITVETKDGSTDIIVQDGNTTYVFIGKNADKLYEKAESANKDGLTEISLMEKSKAEDLLTKQNAKLEKIKTGVRNTTIKLTSRRTSKGISLAWTKSKGYKLDGFQVYRSVKKNSGYGKKAFFTVNNGTKSKYTNTKNLKTGNTYYYKVRGFRVVNGTTVYTKWSNKAYRTINKK